MVPRLTMAPGTVPFISQIVRAPVVVFWNRMSTWPSLLKSPVPPMSSSVETVAK